MVLVQVCFALVVLMSVSAAVTNVFRIFDGQTFVLAELFINVVVAAISAYVVVVW